MYYLKGKASFDGVTDLRPVDTAEAPFEYTFEIVCIRCREKHSKPVTINRFEQHEGEGTRGTASFVYRCQNCKHQHSANIESTGKAIANDGAYHAILQIDSRGLEVERFIPEGVWQCVGEESGTKFEEVEVEDGEWYDYDEKAGVDVSITEVEWEVSRL